MLVKCKVKNCKREYLIQGYCCYHYLKKLDKFEKKSKKANLKVNKKEIIYG
jgi:hypothetical protein